MKRGCQFFLKMILYWRQIFFLYRHVSDYLKVHERDPKAHKFLGQVFEKEGEINKAIGCYKVWNIDGDYFESWKGIVCFFFFQLQIESG